MNKKKVFLWLGIALVLLLGAALLWYRGGRYFYLAYPLLVAAGIIVIDVFRKNWAILSGLFAAAGLALRFLFRGYAYWGYIAIGIAALIAAQARFLKPVQQMAFRPGIIPPAHVFVHFFDDPSLRNTLNGRFRAVRIVTEDAAGLRVIFFAQWFHSDCSFAIKD